MKKPITIMLTLLMFVGMSFYFASCKKDEGQTQDEKDQAAYDAADGVEGARLYDMVLDYKDITDDNLRAKPDFYRCKSCHGWDLKGRKGVLIGKKSSDTYPVVADVDLIGDVRPNDGIRKIYDAIANVGGRDPHSGTYDATMPDYSNLLSEDDIWNLVKFIKETAHQTDDFYTLTTTGTYPNGTKAFSDIGKNGDAAAGLATYNAKCASCHGTDGSKINIYCKGEWLGDMFRNDPHEIQHKSVWGMPFDWAHSQAGCTDAGQMPPTGITDDDIRNMMVMGQDEEAFPDYHEGLSDQEKYDAADGVEGARLYDMVLDYKNLTDDNLRANPNFFRCKSCHGWDLKGRDGVLIDKHASDTYPVVADVDLIGDVRPNDGIREIYDAIANVGGRDPNSGTYDATMPDYTNLLSEDDIWNLVKFIKETAHQTDDFYTLTTTGTYPDGTKAFSDIGKNGDPVAGLATYNAKCASCHGNDGSKINIYCKGEWLGDMFRNDPHEIQHKSIWGMPFDWAHYQAGCTDAGQMPPTGITDDDIRNMMVMGQDETTFPDYHD